MDRINCPASACWQRTSSGEERDRDICAMHINATIDYAETLETEERISALEKRVAELHYEKDQYDKKRKSAMAKTQEWREKYYALLHDKQIIYTND